MKPSQSREDILLFHAMLADVAQHHHHPEHLLATHVVTRLPASDTTTTSPHTSPTLPHFTKTDTDQDILLTTGRPPCRLGSGSESAREGSKERRSYHTPSLLLLLLATFTNTS
jgi:hypothetical protein